jgi:cell division protein FtsZ
MRSTGPPSPDPSPSGSPPPPWGDLVRIPKALVVGLGGAGSEVVTDLFDQEVPGVETLAINTDGQHLMGARADRRLLIAQGNLAGRGAGGDVEKVLQSTSEIREDLLARFRAFDLTFLLAGLGGGTGSALAPLCLSLAREAGTIPVTGVFLPFHVELSTSPRIRENTTRALRELQEGGGVLLVLANERLRKFDRLPIKQVFQYRNSYLRALISGLVNMVRHPSEMNVDLAHLRRMLSAGGLSTVLYAEGHPSDPEGVVHQAFREGLLDFQVKERAGPTILFVEGGNDLTFGAYHKIVDSFRRELRDPGELTPGFRTHPERWDRVRVTALVGGLEPKTLERALSN